MLWIHIAGGLVALAAGYVALGTRKGASTHRFAGRAFAYAMFTMTVSGAIIAALLRPNPGNVLAAALTFYLVGTGWLAVRPGVGHAPRRTRAFAALGALIGLYGAGLAAVAFGTPANAIGGIPAMAMAVFASVALLGSLGDWRALQRGMVRSPLVRHIGRMGLALWIATASFFFGQADEFPAAVRQSGVLVVPVAGVALALAYYLLRQGIVSRRAARSKLARSALA